MDLYSIIVYINELHIYYTIDTSYYVWQHKLRLVFAKFINTKFFSEIKSKQIAKPSRIKFITLLSWINPLPENEEGYIYISKIKENLIHCCYIEINNSTLDILQKFKKKNKSFSKIDYTIIMYSQWEREKIFLPPRNHKIFVFFSLNRSERCRKDDDIIE